MTQASRCIYLHTFVTKCIRLAKHFKYAFTRIMHFNRAISKENNSLYYSHRVKTRSKSLTLVEARLALFLPPFFSVLSTPMMDLLVQIATAHKLAASSYTLQAIGERGSVLPHQPNTPIGALDALQVISIDPSCRVKFFDT